MKRSSIFVAMLAPAAVIALNASAVQAAPSHRERSHYTVESPGVIDCGTFQDNFTDFYDIDETDVFDRDGNLVQVVFHMAHHSDDTNSVSGLTLHEHGHFTEMDDLIHGTYTFAGSLEIMSRPGTGVVVKDAGRLVADSEFNLVFFAGDKRYSEVLLGEQVLCDALG